MTWKALMLMAVLVASREARADNAGYALFTTGLQVNSTSIHDHPATDDTFTTTGVPTLGFQYWGPRAIPVFLHMHFDGVVASFVHLSEDKRVMPMLGGDVGFAFRAFGGKLGFGAGLEAFDLRHPDLGLTFDNGKTIDLFGQLRYTHPIAHRVRIDLMAEAGASGGDVYDKGSVGAANLQLLYKLNRQFSIYASLAADVRTYKDPTLPKGEFSLVTTMFRIGVAVHHIGSFGANDF